MRSMVGVALCIASTAAQAECGERVAEAQVRIAAVLQQPLTAAEQAELSAVLYQLCEPRPAGASVVEEPSRTVRTTHGLNPRETRVDDDDIAPIIAVEVEGRRRHRGGDRDGRRKEP